MWGKHLISQLEITEKFCYYSPPPTGVRGTRKNSATTPPPLNRVGSWRSRKNSATTPPPLNRVGFWRSRKRLKKFNKLNLAALNVIGLHHINLFVCWPIYLFWETRTLENMAWPGLIIKYILLLICCGAFLFHILLDLGIYLL